LRLIGEEEEEETVEYVEELSGRQLRMKEDLNRRSDAAIVNDGCNRSFELEFKFTAAGVCDRRLCRPDYGTGL